MTSDDPITNAVVAFATEGAKAAAAPIGTRVGRLVSDVLELAGADWLHEKCRENATRIRAKVDENLKGRPIDDDDRAKISPSVALPLVMVAAAESREELQDLWARLIANAIDPKRSARFRVGFIDTIRQLEPIDAKILSELSSGDAQNAGNTANHFASKLGVRMSTTAVALTNLERLGCAWRHNNTGVKYMATSYAEEILAAVEP